VPASATARIQSDSHRSHDRIPVSGGAELACALATSESRRSSRPRAARMIAFAPAGPRRRPRLRNATPGPVAAGCCLRADRSPDSTNGWEPIHQHAIDAETIVGNAIPITRNRIPQRSSQLQLLSAWGTDRRGRCERMISSRALRSRAASTASLRTAPLGICAHVAGVAHELTRIWRNSGFVPRGSQPCVRVRASPRSGAAAVAGRVRRQQHGDHPACVSASPLFRAEEGL